MRFYQMDVTCSDIFLLLKLLLKLQLSNLMLIINNDFNYEKKDIEISIKTLPILFMSQEYYQCSVSN
jgi:hypothetical protein